MTTDPRNRQPEQAYEQDLEALRSAWDRLEKAEPPDLTNQAVLSLAKRELEAQGRAFRKRRSFKWLGAFATATIVVLALTLTIEQEQHSPVPAIEEADGIRLDRVKEFADEAEAPADTAAVKAGRENLSKHVPRQNVASAPAAEMKMADADALPESAENELPGAEDWIEQLLLLKESGQDASLAEELAAFRAAYPDYVLPPGLDD